MLKYWSIFLGISKLHAFKEALGRRLNEYQSLVSTDPTPRWMSLTYWTDFCFRLQGFIGELHTLTNSRETRVDFNIIVLNDKRKIVDSWQGIYVFKNHKMHSQKNPWENAECNRFYGCWVTLLYFPGFTILSAFFQTRNCAEVQQVCQAFTKILQHKTRGLLHSVGDQRPEWSEP